MGGKPPEEFLGTPSKSVIYHPRNMSGKFGAIGRHVTISRLRALTKQFDLKHLEKSAKFCQPVGVVSR